MAHGRKSLHTVLNCENLPPGGVLIVPNRFSFHDLLSLEGVLNDRSLVYLTEKDAQLSTRLRQHLERDDVAALAFSRDAGAGAALKGLLEEQLAGAKVVVFVPGETVVRPGSVNRVPGATHDVLLAAGAPTVPLFIEYPAELRLEIESRRETDYVIFSFGKLLEGEEVTPSAFQENLLLAGEAAFGSRSVLDLSLAFALLRGLKRHGRTDKIIDGLDDGELRFDKMLGVSIAFANLLKAETAKERIGIILPPGRAGMIANLAVLFAGKVPVNLNFTAGKGAIDSSIKQAGLDRFITVDKFVRKMSRFPWPPTRQLVFLERAIPQLKLQTLFWYLAGRLLPAGALASLAGISREGGDTEAVLLFTSGSSGEPKGVPLTHRNLIANVNQFGARLNLSLEDRLLGCLPLFHSFGCTVTLWYPVIEGVTIVSYPSPLDAGKHAELIEKHRISLVLSTPTFLRGYLRKAEPEQFASAKLVVTGAEKLPRKVAEEFEKKFGKPVLEGYGLTETSPVTNVNLPDPEPDPEAPGKPVLPSSRPGSVGQMLPGIAVRIADPESGEPLPLHRSGMIWLRGANIFPGYLHKPELTRDVLRDGWFRTGDIGRVDEDGFLYIEGRLSRFSKIGGEMVPHETIEAAISKELNLDSDHERKVAIIGVPDEAKGESLVLLSAAQEEIDPTALRYHLLEAGISNLWIPKKIVKVGAIPVLASGKLDLKGCEEAAKGK